VDEVAAVDGGGVVLDHDPFHSGGPRGPGRVDGVHEAREDAGAGGEVEIDGSLEQVLIRSHE